MLRSNGKEFLWTINLITYTEFLRSGLAWLVGLAYRFGFYFFFKEIFFCSKASKAPRHEFKTTEVILVLQHCRVLFWKRNDTLLISDEYLFVQSPIFTYYKIFVIFSDRTSTLLITEDNSCFRNIFPQNHVKNF